MTKPFKITVLEKKQVFSLLILATAWTPGALAQQGAVPARPDSETVQIASLDAKRWTHQRALQWYQSQPWPCGFNYVPAHTISYTEMFMPYNFDAKKIDSEFTMAQADGFNCIRIVLPFVVWEHDPAAFKARFSAFLQVASRHGLKVMPALFDDCVFGHTADPIYGRQPVVVPGWYANGWTPSPGHAIVRDQKQWTRLEKYVKDMIGTYKNDERVWLWDLYNEPTNGGIGEVTVPLVGRVFDWARQIAPVQPLTCDVFGSPAMQRLALDRSDVITFHNYDPADSLQANIDQLRLAGRPIICSEWLNRARQSTPQNCLPIFTRENVGAIHWGYINGRTQTNFPWGSKAGMPSPRLWQHDLYRSEYTVESIPAGGYGFGTDYDPTAAQRNPYDPAEIALFRKTIADMAKTPRTVGGSKQWVLPTALSNDASNVWHYTTTQPAGDWSSENFDDTHWKTGPAGFGTEAPNAWVRTNWSNDDIWIRRTIALDKVPTQATLYLHYDEDPEVYFNGQKVFEVKGYTDNYKTIPVSAAALAALKPGKNVIAVHCHQTTGGQYIDMGLSVPRTP